MKKFILMVCATLLLNVFGSKASSSTSQLTSNNDINIIPKPTSVEKQKGKFKLVNANSIYSNTSEGKIIAELFASKLQASTGYDFNFTEKEKTGNISLIMNPKLMYKEDQYKLSVTPKGVSVLAKTPKGLFYGMQSFMQLLPPQVESNILQTNIDWSAPCVTINDEPRFGYRGVMLDPCRHFIPVENVKKQLDVMALFKMNTMHFHLTDDQGWRIEIKKYPKLTEIGSSRIDGEGTEYKGYYTQEEIKDIVKYASERFITVIPELETPGHELAAISAYPHLSCKGEDTTPRIIWGVEDIVMCPGKEDMFTFLEDVIKEMVPLFPGTYFHIGGDECPKSSWKNCEKCQARIKAENLTADNKHTAEERLQSYVIGRMENILAKYGKKIIGWDEILEGGLSSNATVMSWRGEQGGIEAALQNHDVIMTPGGNGMYLDTYQGDRNNEPVAIGGFTTLEKVYSYNPVPDTLKSMNKEHFVKGVQCNNWSEYMYNTDIMEYRMYPRLLAVSEIAWTDLGNKDYKDFERRINDAQIRLDGHGINYHIPYPEQLNGSCNFVAFTDNVDLEFKTTRPYDMVYTLDGTEPNIRSAKYSGPIKISESKILKIRTLLPSGKMGPTRNITVEKQNLSPASLVKTQGNGLNMKMTMGTYFKSSELDNAKDWKKMNIKELKEIRSQVESSESMRGVEQYSAIATGYINIPEDGVYYFSSENEQVWIDGKLLINNEGEVKRFSRKDSSMALAKGLHEIKVIFLGHIMGGWPSMWNDGSVKIKKAGEKNFAYVTGEQLFY
ncbi:family 20 glycosylhydrolase [Phocaeicola paurosaccharolyticus]|jgi:hexosaminidase|uniref:family 20 glycosylhydrolase n=1 Tax=Phocaeicola paurosaccharolyticus TaxID=732242 RepID=UPI00046A5718|nr:family 20 glycosylhydrolase [Phocaeicola paurosaccharolyticus]